MVDLCPRDDTLWRFVWLPLTLLGTYLLYGLIPGFLLRCLPCLAASACYAGPFLNHCPLHFHAGGDSSLGFQAPPFCFFRFRIVSLGCSLSLLGVIFVVRDDLLLNCYLTGVPLLAEKICCFSLSFSSS